MLPSPLPTHQWRVPGRLTHGAACCVGTQAAAVNWALAKEGVTPSGTAHRNTPASKLPAPKAGGKAGELFLTGVSGAQLPVGWKAMGGPEYEELYQGVTAFLSASPDVYVEDAALGSYSAMALPTRAITDDAATASFIKASLCPIPSNVTTFASAVTIYAASGFKPASGEGPIAAVNVERGEVILAGGASGATMAAAVAPVAEHYNAQQGLAPLSGLCSVVGGKTFVVCAAGGAAPSGIPGTPFASQVVVGNDGIWSLFKTDGPNVLKLPSAIVLVGEGAGIPEAATLTPQQAAIYALGLKITASADAAEALARLSESTGTPVLLCSSAAAAAKTITAGSSPPPTEVTSAVVDFVLGNFGGLPEDILAPIRPVEKSE